ncbi:putative CtpA-like serine protease [Vallitalea longa]|uniref:CtpA-like serine protease n=1 Tax=Vallitalea longa TaxID=2936439 RepID=A0A9W5Y7Q6_9FIRM|nr:S41 family peptidase [Vallitalea longa]GKX28525.1 putative CtpA-like serine protease [Vallitalea longa]
MRRFFKKVVIVTMVLCMLIVPVNVNANDDDIDKYENYLEIIYENIMEYYAGSEVTEEQLFEAAAYGMFYNLDPYSKFLKTKEADKLVKTISGEFVGVGIEVVQDGEYVKIVSPLPDSPAIKAGMKAEDIIIAIDGYSIKGLAFQDVINKLSGEEGTRVSITLKRGKEEITLDVKRKLVKTSAIETEDMKKLFPKVDDEVLDKINYIKINGINANVAEDIEPYLNKAKKKGVKYLIFDLRDNSGGYVGTGVDLCKLLVPEGPIVKFVNKEGYETIYTSDLKKAPFELVVLTNENTASASEFIAAAIKDSGIGVTVGETTFGKGVAQYIYDMTDKYSIKLTMEEFFSRDGHKINGIGVKPDYEVPVPNYIISSERLFLNDEMVEVKVVELILEYLGYEIDEPDNMYDEKTEKAITEFQKKMGLRAYGVADYPTLNALNKCLHDSISQKDIQLEKAMEVILSKINEN